MYEIYIRIYNNCIFLYSTSVFLFNKHPYYKGFVVDKTKTIQALLTLMLASMLVSAQNDTLHDAQTKICGILEQFYDLLLYIASGIGALMIVFLGLLWVTSADNTKARTDAKNGIVHVVIGLIIVSIAVTLVNLVLPAGSRCIENW